MCQDAQIAQQQQQISFPWYSHRAGGHWLGTPAQKAVSLVPNSFLQTVSGGGGWFRTPTTTETWGRVWQNVSAAALISD